MSTGRVLAAALITTVALDLLSRTAYASVADWISSGLLVGAVYVIVERNIRTGQYRWKR